MNIKVITLFTILSLSINIFAQQDTSKINIRKPKLILDFTLIDAPYQNNAANTVSNGSKNIGSYLKAYANPSMNQSLSYSSTLYSAAHYGIDKLFRQSSHYGIDNIFQKKSSESTGCLKPFLYTFTILFSDFVLTYAPGGDGWLHEEYHRSVLTRFGANSFNDMNTFPIGAELISVNNVKDEDLIRFKQTSPADFIRLHVAGIEGEYLLIDKLQRNNFFYRQNITHEFLYIIATANSIAYVKICSDPSEVNSITDELNYKESEISKRDFTGLDFTAWAYDLFNPNEPYENRGIHISGNGIDRYRKTTDLSDDALKYLKKQGNLQFLNILSPMLIGFRRIKLNDGLYGNFAVRNYLTSFGNDISLNIYLQNDKRNMVFAYHHASNYKNWFPAFQAELFEEPITFGKHKFVYSPKLLVGLQPKKQEFKTSKASFLGEASCRIDWLIKKVQPWISFSAKTDGWIAGNEFLNKNISFRAGLAVRFYSK